jgi:hypothetical protein
MSKPAKFVKHDDGKPRLDLLPFDVLEQVGHVLTFGAEKYTRYGECSCCVRNVRSATGTQEGFAGHATTKTSSGAIRATQNDSVETRLSGRGNTRSTEETMLGGAPLSTPQSDMEFPLRESKSCCLGDASCAGETTLCASTTTTEEGGCADACVSRATSALAGSKTQSGQSWHDPTCNVHRVVAEGADNWRRCTEPRRYLAAALRHLFALGRGERLDPETGKHHAVHAACCCLFLAGVDHAAE